METESHDGKQERRKASRKAQAKLKAAAYANSRVPFEVAKQDFSKGISVTRDPRSELADVWKPSGVGRPQTNVFERNPRAKGKILAGEYISIAASRRSLLMYHDLMVISDLALKEHDRLMKSHVREKLGRPDWTVHFVAELAWLLMGNKFIEKIDNRPIRMRNNLRFVDETTALWRFINEYIARYSVAQRGPNPNAERLFKATLATFVARKLIQPKGGNSKVMPSNREVSQVWFVLFGEFESHDNIKKLVEKLPQYLIKFVQANSGGLGLRRVHFVKLVPAIKCEFGP